MVISWLICGIIGWGISMADWGKCSHAIGEKFGRTGVFVSFLVFAIGPFGLILIIVLVLAFDNKIQWQLWKGKNQWTR